MCNVITINQFIYKKKYKEHLPQRASRKLSFHQNSLYLPRPVSGTVNQRVPLSIALANRYHHPWYSIRLVAITYYLTTWVCARVENRAVGARSSDVTRSMFHQVRGHEALFFPRALCNDEALKPTFSEANTAARIHVTRPFSDAIREWFLRNVVPLSECPRTAVNACETLFTRLALLRAHCSYRNLSSYRLETQTYSILTKGVNKSLWTLSWSCIA